MPDARRAGIPGGDTSRTTSGGLALDPWYGSPDGASERPGEYPYTRGIHESMYRGRHWTMRQYAGYATAEESNRRYRFLLEGGQTGLSVAFDLPTQLGLDPDDPLAEGEVGRVGVSIASVEDMAVLLDGIPIDRVSVSMTINATASILLAYYVAVAIERGIPLASLSGTTQNDILKEYVARGTQAYPPRPSLGVVTGMIAYTARDLPRWNPISISGYHIREAGATAVQELAFTLANGLEYARRAVAAGMGIDTFAPRLSFFFACHNDFFEEIAKFRAARRVWAGLMRDRLGATRPESLKLRFHTQTAGSTLAAQEAPNNVVRVALQAMAAVLGGTQSLHCNALDEALALPTEATARLALRTQQVIAYESGVAEVADPLGGSWFVERLTDEVAQAATSLIDEVERIGGALRAVETGFYARHIEDSAYRYQREVDRGDRTIVGVNRFSAEAGSGVPDLLRVDGEVGVSQRARVEQLRAGRDGARVSGALARVRDAAQASLKAPGTATLMEALVEGALARATTGELAGAMRDVFGPYRESG